MKISEEEKRITREKVAKPLLWVAMITMVMLFASLTSAYVVRQMKGDWLQFELPQLFYISTAFIILSSVTMNWVLSAAKKNDFKNIQLASLITLILGVAFVICQFKAWSVLVDQKIFFAGKYSNASGSFLYALTGLHMAHLIGGILALMVVWVKSLMKRYNSENLLGIRLCAIFWHFLDGLWIYLFLFLLFVR
ncbi:MAG: cytochrome c oxidase subunit 3 [Bacteroidota bacterium]